MANEKRLIDGNKAQAVLVNMAEHLLEAGNPEMAGAVGYAAEIIGKQKVVDAVEIVHGRWIFGTANHREYMKCSVCLKSQTPTGVFTYCPNCGAKMVGGGEGG